MQLSKCSTHGIEYSRTCPECVDCIVDNWWERIGKMTDELNASRELGARGGKATLEKYGKEHFSKIAKGWPKGKKRKVVS